MTTHEIQLEGYEARLPGNVRALDLGTAGSRGNEQLHVTLGTGWTGLTVKAVFHPCWVELLVPSDGVMEVPWEATERPLLPQKGRIVFCGVDGDRVVITADVGYAVHGHSPTAGKEPAQATPGIVEQVLAQTAEDRAAAEAAAAKTEAALVHAPQINEERNWEIWNPDTGQYKDTGVTAQGVTPQRGVDYWTQADQQTVVADVLAALPNGDEVAY